MTNPWARDLEPTRAEIDAVVAAGVRLVLSATDIAVQAKARRIQTFTWQASGAEETHPTQLLVLALGRLHDMPFLPHRTVELAEDGRVVADPATGQTGLPGVFAVGECALGPLRVAEAIASGVRVAGHVDRWLGGDGELPPNVDATFLDDQIWGKRLPTVPGARPAVPPGGARGGPRAEAVGTLPDDAARGESMRCRRCRIFA